MFRSRNSIESEILDANAARMDRLVWSNNEARCSNPECRIPLESGKAHMRAGLMGDVCDLCFEMYRSVNRTHFLSAHADWEQENAERRSLLKRVRDNR